MQAANSNHSKVLELLLQYGGDVNCCANMYSRCTPLHVAASCGHEDCVQVLMDRNNVDITIVDKFDRTPMQLAEYGNQQAVVNILKSAG